MMHLKKSRNIRETGNALDSDNHSLAAVLNLGRESFAMFLNLYNINRHYLLNKILWVGIYFPACMVPSCTYFSNGDIILQECGEY
jgi:hypothetical protein